MPRRCAAVNGARPQSVQDQQASLVGDDASNVRPGLIGPVDQPLRHPFRMFAVALGHMLGLGNVPAFVLRAQVAGHALVGVEALHRLCGQAYFELMLHQQAGHRAVMASNFDVVVDIYPHLFPFRADLRMFRQRL